MLATTKQVVLDLMRTREILVERGRAKGCYEREDGRVCLLGAMLHAVGVPLRDRCPRNVYAMVGALGFGQLDTNFYLASRFNDTSDDATVLARLDKAIAEQLAT